MQPLGSTIGIYKPLLKFSSRFGMSHLQQHSQFSPLRYLHPLQSLAAHHRAVLPSVSLIPPSLISPSLISPQRSLLSVGRSGSILKQPLLAKRTRQLPPIPFDPIDPTIPPPSLIPDGMDGIPDGIPDGRTTKEIADQETGSPEPPSARLDLPFPVSPFAHPSSIEPSDQGEITASINDLSAVMQPSQKASPKTPRKASRNRIFLSDQIALLANDFGLQDAGELIQNENPTLLNPLQPPTQPSPSPAPKKSAKNKSAQKPSSGKAKQQQKSASHKSKNRSRKIENSPQIEAFPQMPEEVTVPSPTLNAAESNATKSPVPVGVETVAPVLEHPDPLQVQLVQPLTTPSDSQIDRPNQNTEAAALEPIDIADNVAESVEPEPIDAVDLIQETIPQNTQLAEAVKSFETAVTPPSGTAEKTIAPVNDIPSKIPAASKLKPEAALPQQTTNAEPLPVPQKNRRGKSAPRPKRSSKAAQKNANPAADQLADPSSKGLPETIPALEAAVSPIANNQETVRETTGETTGETTRETIGETTREAIAFISSDVSAESDHPTSQIESSESAIPSLQVAESDSISVDEPPLNQTESLRQNRSPELFGSKLVNSEGVAPEGLTPEAFDSQLLNPEPSDPIAPTSPNLLPELLDTAPFQESSQLQLDRSFEPNSDPSHPSPQPSPKFPPYPPNSHPQHLVEIAPIQSEQLLQEDVEHEGSVFTQPERSLLQDSNRLASRLEVNQQPLPAEDPTADSVEAYPSANQDTVPDSPAAFPIEPTNLVFPHPMEGSEAVPVQGYSIGGQVIQRQLPTGKPIAPSDTVPAMLTPGEFVVNAQDAQKHLPLLRHLNQGGDLGDAPISAAPTQDNSPSEVIDSGEPVTPAQPTLPISRKSKGIQRQSKDRSLLPAVSRMTRTTFTKHSSDAELLSPQFNSSEAAASEENITYSLPTLIHRSASASTPPKSFSGATSMALPEQWNSVEDLLGVQATLGSDRSTGVPLNTAIEMPTIVHRAVVQGFETGGEVAVPTPVGETPPSESITVPTEEGNAQDTEQKQEGEMENLAQEIYIRLRLRLEIERERQGLYSGRLPW